MFGGTSDSVLIQYAGMFEPYPQLPWTQFDDDQRMVLLWTSVRRVHGGIFHSDLTSMRKCECFTADTDTIRTW